MYNSLQNHATSGSMNFFPLVLSLGSRTAPRKRMVSRCPIKPWDFRVISHGNILNVYIYIIYIYIILYIILGNMSQRILHGIFLSWWWDYILLAPPGWLAMFWSIFGSKLRQMAGSQVMNPWIHVWEICFSRVPGHRAHVRIQVLPQGRYIIPLTSYPKHFRRSWCIHSFF